MTCKTLHERRLKRGTKRALGINSVTLILTISAVCVLFVTLSLAHPGSGIVVNKKGEIFFADLSRGLLKIDAHGKVTTIGQEGGHWLALDETGGFSRVNFEKSKHWPRWFKRRTLVNVRPALITDGGSPLVVGLDGNIYYVCDDERMIPGGLQIGQLSPDGKEKLLNPNLRRLSKELGGIKGLALGPDGSLYFTYPKAVLTITMEGKITTLVNPVVVKDCNLSVSSNEAPFLQGLAVDSHGVTYVAASGCGCVIKITPDGKVATALKAEKPWAPSGVAVHGEDIYVLEHIDPISETHQSWPPRIRKLGRTGKVTTVMESAP